jgi:hypothetical protein
MTTPITDRDLPEELMIAMMRLEEEAYRAGQHGCCEEGASKMANPSCFTACESHGPRCRASLSLLCHALAQWAEGIVAEAAEIAAAQAGYGDIAADRHARYLSGAILALAPRCPTCHGRGDDRDGPCPDCSRGKAYHHWATLNPPSREEKATAAPAWWCCSADYPNHAPDCPERAPVSADDGTEGGR